MILKRYIIQFKAPADRPALSYWEGRYHCLGLPSDPYDVENALLMSEKALKAAVKGPRFPRQIPYAIIPVTCTLEL